jgi:hypothetical protein
VNGVTFVRRSNLPSRQTVEKNTGGLIKLHPFLSGACPSFVRAIAQAASIANLPHCALLRPVLSEFKREQPETETGSLKVSRGPRGRSEVILERNPNLT